MDLIQFEMKTNTIRTALFIISLLQICILLSWLEPVMGKSRLQFDFDLCYNLDTFDDVIW